VEGIDDLIPEEIEEKIIYESTTLPTTRRSQIGNRIIQDETWQALVEARLERDGLVFWTDGSRQEDEWVGCAVVWKRGYTGKRVGYT